ncbi:MAG TPA: PH domain-containing protein [Frankiaceae bacterium]|nr:PH domain-containing protein [Frankiaceae bacterium]
MPPLRVRPRTFVWANPLGLAVISVVNARLSPWFLLGVPFFLWSAYALRRTGTVADDTGLTVHNGFRVHRVPWADVAMLRRWVYGVRAVRHDGTAVTLPNVEWRALVPDAFVSARSVQAVALRARAAGHEVGIERATL